MKTKAIFSFISFLILSSSLFSQAVTDGLIAYYPFSKGAAMDESGQLNHGSLVGKVKPVADRFGNDCSAMYFDGGGYIVVPSSPSLESPSREVTITAWFMLDPGSIDPRTQLEWITVVCKSNQRSENDDAPQYRLQLTERTISLNTEFTEEMNESWELNKWYFVAMTYNGSTVKAYLDGKAFFSYPYFGALDKTSAPLEIGRDMPGNQEYFVGTLDDILIYDRALSQKEIQKLFKDRSNKVLNYVPCPEESKPQPVQPSQPLKRTEEQPETPAPPQPNIPQIPQQEQEPSEDPFQPNEPIVQDPPAKQDLPTIDTESGTPSGMIPGKEMIWNGDTVMLQETVVVKSPNITIYPYDHRKEDGDIISLNINGIWLMEHYSLRLYGKDEKKAKLSVIPHQENYLISKAWNLGDIPPNTLTLEIDDGVGDPQVVTIESEIGKSGAIKIVYEPDK
jgi:hypothetical protein